MSKSLVVSNIKLGVNEPADSLYKKLRKEGVLGDSFDIRILKKSLDARDKSDIKFTYTLAVSGDFRTASRLGKNCSFKDAKPYKWPKSGLLEASDRHVVVGSGPAGLFAGLILARAGYKPLVIERGEMVEERAKTVKDFWDGKPLDQDSNVCFGEGGAGTFSDGKLNTGVKDELGRNQFVFDTFAKHGADESIRYYYKPHVGTDVLETVVKNIRREIISLGGEFRFNTKLVDIDDAKKSSASGSQIFSSDLNSNTSDCDLRAGAKPLRLEVVDTKTGATSSIYASSIILAVGHSARDIYEMLKNKGADMQAKAFAVGVRVEHPQEMINKSQYGDSYKELYGDALPVADYKLTSRPATGRGLYTFCMCPGGQVVNSTTEDDSVCVNGMSYSARDGRNANSAVIATITTDDFESDDVLAGVSYQSKLEKLAYKVGGGAIPVSTYGDFIAKRKSHAFGDVTPDIKGSYSLSNVSEIFSDDLMATFDLGIKDFGKRIKGFDRDDAVVSGVEGRTSSPVRIVRDEHFESNLKGIFPCGEGAGYAGGITSAAIDGIKVAEEIIRRYKPQT